MQSLLVPVAGLLIGAAFAMLDRPRNKSTSSSLGGEAAITAQTQQQGSAVTQIELKALHAS